MNFIKSKARNFFSDRQGYSSRVQLVGLLLVIGMLLSELILAQFGERFPNHWLVVSSLSVLFLAFVIYINKFNPTKKGMANIATIFALLGTALLVGRSVQTNFSPLILGQLLFAVILMAFIFERVRYLLIYLVGITLIFVSTFPLLTFQDENQLFYLLIIGFVYSFYLISYWVKIGWINMLQFSENVLNSYDRYIIVFNADGNVVYVNPFIMKQLGLDPAVVKVKDWWKHRGMSDEKTEEYKAIIANRVKLNEEVPIYTQELVIKSGEKRIIEWNAQIASGKYYVGHGTDITDDLSAKREAKKLSKVTQALGAGVVISNSKGEISWCNSSLCSIFGYEKHEILGKRPSEVFKVPQFFSEEYAKIIKNGIVIGEAFEIPHYRKDGRLIWVLIKTSNFASDSENGSDSIEVVTDITQQKHSELQVKQISLIAERTQTPVLVCDRSFTINWINSALTTEFGFEFDEIIGSDFKSLYMGNWAQDKPTIVLIDSIKNGLSCQTDILLKGKSEKQWYKLSMDPVNNEYGDVEQFMIVMQNIQKAKDIQALIEQKNSDMIASISYAKRIQTALLPDAFTLKNDLPPHFFYYRPKDIVSGDFYFAKYHLDKLFIAVADCTGHGVPGAMISSIGAAALNNAIFDNGFTDPGDILEHTDGYLKNTLSASEEIVTDGMDIGLLVFDFEENSLNYSGARRPLIIVNKVNQGLTKIPGVKRSIGEFIEDGMDPFSTVPIDIDQEISIYLFTDGITDQFGGKSNKKVRLGRFLELIEKFANEKVSEQENLFVEFFNNWTDNYKTEQTDDMLLFGANINPAYMNKMKSELNRVMYYDH